MHGLNGIVVPLVTPLTDFGEVDVKGVEKLVNHVLGEGVSYYVDGIFVNGTTGEFPWLPVEEQQSMLMVASEVCAHKVPIAFGATGKTIEETIELCAYGERRGVDALVIAPYYFIEEDIVQGMREVARFVKIPIYLYNNPGLTHEKQISAEDFRKILTIDNIRGIKDSSGDMNRLQGYQAVARQKSGVTVFLGDETKMRYVSDVVPSFANLDPVSCRRLDVVYDTPSLRDELQDYITETGKIIYCGYEKIRGGLKYALSVMDICGATVAEPNQRLSGVEKQRIREFLRLNPGPKIHQFS